MMWVVHFLVLCALFLVGAESQTSEAVCLPYYSWTSNSQGKTPCEVAASLLAVCNDGEFEVLPLSLGQHYRGPALVANANPCICSTVVFSLMTACGLCQGRSVLRWSQWSTNCPRVSLSRHVSSHRTVFF
ncbi:hypothetical protein FA15DRAFT_197104 [Coprinopsis marcescibilis]|uniref:Uncharacterized protein n=1 Tax=Coprinopsis marcescibilis TaxID=230819 RepID=A0A5C3LBF2_COPMA|nr:hypothetical protein FA15DRAFT_197104 [Coprinopsis marcescibilis]